MPTPPDADRQIREKLAAGTLPHEARGTTFVGFGTGQVCDGCDTPIAHTDMAYEVEARDRRLRFHVRCVLLWQMHRRPRAGSQ